MPAWPHLSPRTRSGMEEQATFAPQPFLRLRLVKRHGAGDAVDQLPRNGQRRGRGWRPHIVDVRHVRCTAKAEIVEQRTIRTQRLRRVPLRIPSPWQGPQFRRR